MKKGIVGFLFTLLCISMFAQQPVKKGKAYLVSNAHFDSQWNWDVQRSISEFIPKTLNQNLMLLEKYPDYVFNFEGGIKYAWMKEYFPYQYELIKKYIAEGRWHITGSTWDANDTNIPSAESFTRNILYGQLFYEKEFGVRGTDIFLPDCFGFGWTLPSIAAHSGLLGLSTQKLMWRHKPFYNNSKTPFEIGLWEGVDGSRIMLIGDAHNYTTKWRDEDLSESKYLLDIVEKSPIKTVYHYYGTGDTGGAPTIESVKAVEKGVNGNGPVEIISATSDQLYKDYLPFEKHPELPVFNGELLMDVHATGCYTSQAAMKLFNRKNELLADAAERTAVVADWLGANQYPKEMLTEAWKRVIWHQFHDDLTGTSIPRAYEFSWNDEIISMKQFGNVLSSSVGAASRALDTKVKGLPLIIFNPLAMPVSDVIEVSFKTKDTTKDYVIYNEKGQQVTSQVLAYENGSIKVLIAAEMPSCGYVVYDIRKKTNSAKTTTLKVKNNSLENSIYLVTLNENGDISSIFDKINKKELVKEGKTVRLALFPENKSYSWPAWEIIKSEIDKEPISITKDVKISVFEEGPLRATLCVERTYGESSFKQYVRLTEGGQADRIDILNEVNWQTSNALLKAEFPLSITAPEATYDLGLGAVKRGNNTDIAYEVYGQFWADMTEKDKSYGVSILNDSKYGWDKPNDNTIRLTLLHTPGTQDNYSYQNKQDLGKHFFTYSIVGHKNEYQDAGIVAKADILNQKPKAFIGQKHAGSLGKNFSFVQNNNSNVIVKALKQAEKSNEYVVRLYETTGKNTESVKLSFAGKIISASELNGVEDEIAKANYTANRLEFDIKPFSIKTFKVKLEDPTTKLASTESTALKLPYNLKTSTYNAYMGDANFDGKGNSFAAEIFPKEVVSNGVKFTLAGADEPNAVKSDSQEIDLNQGNYNSLYLLVASTGNDVKAQFTIDAKKVDLVIPSYTGFIGQWGHTGYTEAFVKPYNVAYVGTHKHSMILKKDLPYEFTYMYSVKIDLPKNAKKLILPQHSNVVVFAATLVQDENNTLIPAVDLMEVGLPETQEIAVATNKRNYLEGKTVFEKSGETNAKEKAEFAFDNDLSTKWCDTSISKPKYISIDLGKEETIHGWSLYHAGIEDLDYITKEYSLQVKQDINDEWKTIDSVSDNSNPETDRLLEQAVKARYIRLNVTKPDQSEGNILRIFDFQVY